MNGVKASPFISSKNLKYFKQRVPIEQFEQAQERIAELESENKALNDLVDIQEENMVELQIQKKKLSNESTMFRENLQKTITEKLRGREELETAQKRIKYLEAENRLYESFIKAFKVDNERLLKEKQDLESRIEMLEDQSF